MKIKIFIKLYFEGGFALSIQFLQQLAQSSDKEIVAIARAEGFDITTSEVKNFGPIWSNSHFLGFFRHT